jgi:rare lipoprotein A
MSRGACPGSRRGRPNPRRRSRPAAGAPGLRSGTRTIGLLGPALLLALFLSACASVPKATAPTASDRRDRGGRVEVGLASYYADVLEGRRTANGERYRGRAATCAHRTHPFGTRLEIEVIDTGERVVCRVNDRGPFVRGRIVDVSKSLAGKLDLLDRGVAKVRVRPVGR